VREFRLLAFEPEPARKEKAGRCTRVPLEKKLPSNCAEEPCGLRLTTQTLQQQYPRLSRTVKQIISRHAWRQYPPPQE
jgi:hypothetical protein